MSEEEIIKELKVLIGLEEFNRLSYKENKAIQGLLDLYQKEKMNSSNLSEQLNKEREKNKELQEINFRVNNNLLELAEKIENKIIELEEDLKENNYAEKTTIAIKYAIKVLQELLEERN